MVVDRGVSYGPLPRQTLDTYLPLRHVQQLEHWRQHAHGKGQQQQQSSQLHQSNEQQQNVGEGQQQQQQGQVEQEGQPKLAPVVLFCHGGVWASGE